MDHFLIILMAKKSKIDFSAKVDNFDCKKSQKIDCSSKVDNFCLFCEKDPKFVSHDSLKNKLSPKSAKMDYFLIILMAKKSKIDFSAKVDHFDCKKSQKIDCSSKVDNFCLFCEKGS